MMRYFIWFSSMTIVMGLETDSLKNIGQPISGLYLSGDLDVSKVVNMTNVVLKSIKQFQRCMRNQSNPYNIMTLDPLFFSIKNLCHRITIQLDGEINGTVTQLSRFNIDYLSVTMSSNSARAKFTIPQLNLTGCYNILGTMARFLPIFGSGSFNVTLKNISVDMALALGTEGQSDYLYLSQFNCDFHPQQAKISLGGLLGGGPLGNLVEQFLQISSLEIVSRAHRGIKNGIESSLSKAINSSLTGVNIEELTTFLISFGNKTSAC